MTPKNLLSLLPGEIRNTIFRLAILSPTPLKVEPLCLAKSPKLHQPSLAFTSHTIRHEVLSIFYAENTFYLGTIGYHDPTHIRLWDFNNRLSRWKSMLGPFMTYLKDLRMSIDGRCYAWDGVIPGNAEYEMRVVGEGRVKFEMNGMARCTCRLKEGVEEEASRDGGVLLEVMKEYSASYCEAVCEGHCDRCGRTRLEKFGETEVRHLPLWEDIVTC